MQKERFRSKSFTGKRSQKGKKLKVEEESTTTIGKEKNIKAEKGYRKDIQEPKPSCEAKKLTLRKEHKRMGVEGVNENWRKLSNVKSSVKAEYRSNLGST